MLYYTDYRFRYIKKYIYKPEVESSLDASEVLSGYLSDFDSIDCNYFQIKKIKLTKYLFKNKYKVLKDKQENIDKSYFIIEERNRKVYFNGIEIPFLFRIDKILYANEEDSKIVFYMDVFARNKTGLWQERVQVHCTLDGLLVCLRSSFRIFVNYINKREVFLLN